MLIIAWRFWAGVLLASTTPQKCSNEKGRSKHLKRSFTGCCAETIDPYRARSLAGKPLRKLTQRFSNAYICRFD
ncbi:hypothetical protein SAMN05444164_3763 [Bradyrhizobium erythrophlei]|uniref:Uncharacterized protein n=1 Tax=Bradyrhizobium erythrophlei TaxID=1437360 RepID=A0A1H4Y2X8_9BRAD|nr:hypothetical protein SAMN05444164_3763 [Bradyrhizobium erythrophlei]